MEELDGIGIDDIVNLEDSPRFVFIDEECENLIVVKDGGDLLAITTKKKSGVLQQSIDVHYMTNAVGDIISSVTK